MNKIFVYIIMEFQDMIYRETPITENEFVGTIKPVKNVRKKKANKKPKATDVFDMKWKQGKEVKTGKKKKKEIVMPYQKKNFKTGKSKYVD